ncbi:hypothetical protein B0T40_04435 [Chromobacterium haemolyticum]|uniref:hypothetical protein n=1 Tax=Chromobacterium haemolyticum TaxID=394935 RepID=UPI0009D9201F|nr:hypothetical protein [Chromobacterium haemolyticum]OQS39040.1 hypothetical protein B0T40_04435 [Chromobacterium haemolyticum]
MKLSKEQKQELIDKLSYPWGRVSLQCDGYQISLVVRRSKGMTYRVVTYVNGSWDGKWMSGREEHPEQKFLRKTVRQVVSKKERGEMEKAVGKRHFKRMCADNSFWTATMTLYDVSWASGKAAINHLCKVCDSIEILIEQPA